MTDRPEKPSDPKAVLRDALEVLRVAIGGTPVSYVLGLQALEELAARTAEIRPHCWHCQVALEPETPRCESCPAPNDCDVEGCQEPGCTGEDCVQAGCRQCATTETEEQAAERVWFTRLPGGEP